MKQYSSAIVSMAMSSVEGISVELFYIITHVPTVVIAIISAPIGGCILLIVHRVIQRQPFTIHHSWKMLLIICVLFALIQFTWFDAVKRIGAGKTALILVPLEVLASITFAWFILSERLHRLQMFGGIIVISGVTLSITSDVAGDNSNNNLTQFGIGELEAIASALMSGLVVCVTTRLLKKHGVAECSGILLFTSGLILSLSLPFTDVGPLFGNSSGYTWLYLILIAPMIPLLLTLSDMLSLKRIGASLTTIIWSCSSILTVILSFTLVQYTQLQLTIPDNMTLAIAGGIVSVIGIGLIFKQQ